MNKKLIKKTMFNDVNEIEDEELTAEWKAMVSKAPHRIAKLEYNKVVMYFPFNRDTYKGKTNAELFKKCENGFAEAYRQATKEKKENISHSGNVDNKA